MLQRVYNNNGSLTSCGETEDLQHFTMLHLSLCGFIGQLYKSRQIVVRELLLWLNIASVPRALHISYTFRYQKTY